MNTGPRSVCETNAGSGSTRRKTELLIGPVRVPSEPGENTFDWGSMEISNDGNIYHPAILTWPEGLDNSNGGAVSFAGPAVRE